jgi:hypothetical protein
MVYGQVEKLLMKMLLEPQFRKEVISLGKTACARFSCDEGEAEVLLALLANQGAGLAAVLSVIESAIDVRLSLGLCGKFPHDLPDGHRRERFTSPGDAFNTHAG